MTSLLVQISASVPSKWGNNAILRRATIYSRGWPRAAGSKEREVSESLTWPPGRAASAKKYICCMFVYFCIKTLDNLCKSYTNHQNHSKTIWRTNTKERQASKKHRQAMKSIDKHRKNMKHALESIKRKEQTSTNHWKALKSVDKSMKSIQKAWSSIEKDRKT